MIEDYIDYSPDCCPECGSSRTYWVYLHLGVFKCEDCGLIVDDDWYRANEPEIIKGKNYPDEDEEKAKHLYDMWEQEQIENQIENEE